MNTPKEKRLCFRLEKDGYGIYRSGIAETITPPSDERHPAPRNDGLLIASGFDPWDSNYFYGYTDCKQLLNWWYSANAINAMRRARVRLVVFETDDYYVGNTQMTFRKSTARKLGECDPGLIPELAERNIDNEYALNEYVAGLAPFVRTEQPICKRPEYGSGNVYSGKMVQHRPLYPKFNERCVRDSTGIDVQRSSESCYRTDTFGFTFASSLFQKRSN